MRADWFEKHGYGEPPCNSCVSMKYGKGYCQRELASCVRYRKWFKQAWNKVTEPYRKAKEKKNEVE